MYKVRTEDLERIKKQLNTNNKELDLIAKGQRNVSNVNVTSKINNLINNNKKLIKFIEDVYHIN